MVVLNEGLDRITTLIANDITDALAGTDNTTPSATQTGLISPVAATEANVTVTVGSRSIQTSHVISSVVATGNTFTEWIIRMNSDATDLSRAVTAGVSHTANTEITKITTIRIEGS